MNRLLLLKDLGAIHPTIGSKYKKRYGMYKCYCGNEFKTSIQSVKNGNTTSCGCYNKQKAKELNHTHGLRQHRLYRIFQDMKNRCYNKNRKAYKDYGGRGITVYNKWLNDFKSFYDWAMGNGYRENLTIFNLIILKFGI